MTKHPNTNPYGPDATDESWVVSDRASVSGVRRRVRAELNRCGAPPAASFDCLVALTEACTNALLHGRGPDADAPAPTVDWIIDSHAARFFVKDYSNRRWSMAAHPSRSLINLNAGDIEARIGGFGIQLMHRLMDDVQISIEPHGTTVQLVKFFPTS